MAYVAHLHSWTRFLGSNHIHLLVPVRRRRSRSRAAYTKLVLQLELLLMELLLQWHDKLMTQTRRLLAIKEGRLQLELLGCLCAV